MLASGNLPISESVLAARRSINEWNTTGKMTDEEAGAWRWFLALMVLSTEYSDVLYDTLHSVDEVLISTGREFGRSIESIMGHLHE